MRAGETHLFVWCPRFSVSARSNGKGHAKAWTPSGVKDADGAARRPYQQRRGFTLIELILVMLMLIIAVSIVVPSMEKFFGGRSLDSEVRRFIALTRYAQSRAVSEGTPMLLWIDPKAGNYGLQQETGYTDGDAKAEQFSLSDGLSIGLDNSKSSKLAPGKRIGIRFSPDGNILADGSVPAVFIKQGNGAQVWIVQSSDRLSYEVKS
jgi:type II secretion system protein H